MIQLPLPLILLFAGPLAGTNSDSGTTAVVAAWNFEQGDDTDYDEWPDGWTRWRGAGFPHYVRIAIAAPAGPEFAARGRCLKIDLDGGAGRIDSPPIEFRPEFSYVLEGRLRTQGLKHSAARLAITFYDREKKPLATFSSAALRPSGDWEQVRIGPITPPTKENGQAVVHLSLQPEGGADLTGSASFDDIRLGRLPRITLEASSPDGLYVGRRDVEVTCRVSGFSDPSLRVRFELLDWRGATLADEQRATQPDEPLPATSLAAGSSERSRAEDAAATFSGSARWRPPIPGEGFFQVRASIVGHAGSEVANLAVLNTLSRSADGEFGWSLPRGDHPLSLPALVNLLGAAGVHWVKFPLWYEESDKGRAEDLARFAERLSAQRIQLVGLLDRPPAALRSIFAESDPLPVASVFFEPAVWRPALDPILTRLSMKVRWWQLGADRDTSFAGDPDLEAKLRGIHRDLSRFGQELQIGLAWRFLDEEPAAARPPWSFLSLAADPPLTADELRNYLAAPGPPGVRRWVQLEPLSQRDYSRRDQARDLMLRMLAAKTAGAQGIFLTDPFDEECGVMNADGSPGPLLLPWCTTAHLLSGTDYLGSQQLPHGSRNAVFARGSEALMALWSDGPAREWVQLGENVQQIDLWGTRRALRPLAADVPVGHEVEVDDLPTFLVGVDPSLARWSIAAEIETAELAGVFGQAQSAVCRFTNTFPRGVGGTVTLKTPDVWEVEPRRVAFKLAAGETRRQAFQILLGTNASSGRQPVQLDFELSSDRVYRFSVHREIRVGLRDLAVELNSRLDERGNLLVEQRLTNESDRLVSFNCLLSVPQRRRERQQVFRLGRGSVTNVYVLPRGEELLGQTLWLRAEEIGGDRILNFQMVARE